MTQPGTGIACALSTGALCGTGSVLFKYLPGFYNYHVGGWWFAPRWHTIWLCGLIVSVLVWCCHALLRAVEAVGSRVNHRGSAGEGLWLAIPHSIWVTALAIYVGVEVCALEERFVVTAQGTDIHGESYRVLRVEARGRRPGSRRPVTAWLERSAGAVSERLRINRSQTWASLSGSYQLLMDRAKVVNDRVILRHGERRVELSPAKPVRDGSDNIQLNSIHDPEPESSVSVPQADVTIGGRRELLPLDPEWTGENAFLGFKESPVLTLRVRRNLATSLAVAAVAALLVSALLSWFRARHSSRLPR